MNGTPGSSATDQIRRVRQKLEERFSAFDKAMLSEIASARGGPGPEAPAADAVRTEELEARNRALLQEVRELKARLDERAAAPPPAVPEEPGALQEELRQSKEKFSQLEREHRRILEELQSLRRHPAAPSTDADSEALNQRNRMLEETVEKLESELEARSVAPAPAAEAEQEIARLKAQLKNAHEMTSRYLREIEHKNAQLKEQTDILARSRAVRQSQTQDIPAAQAENARLKGENIRLKEQVLAYKMKRLHSAQVWRKILGAYRSLKRSRGGGPPEAVS